MNVTSWRCTTCNPSILTRGGSFPLVLQKRKQSLIYSIEYLMLIILRPINLWSFRKTILIRAACCYLLKWKQEDGCSAPLEIALQQSITVSILQALETTWMASIVQPLPHLVFLTPFAYSRLPDNRVYWIYSTCDNCDIITVLWHLHHSQIITLLWH